MLLLALFACVTEGPIVYRTATDALGAVDLTLDVAEPDPDVSGPGPYPAAIFVHGGAWRQGHLYDLGWGFRHEEAADAGFVGLTINYRLSNETDDSGHTRWAYPDPANDVSCAVRWLRAHAEDFDVDPDRIGLVGYSAGGHLVLDAGFQPDRDDPDCPYEEEADVSIVVSRAGPSDLAAAYDATSLGWAREGIRWLVDARDTPPDEDAEPYERASPIDHIPDNPPIVFQTQGLMDDIVDPRITRALHERLLTQGHDSTYLELSNAGHIMVFDAGLHADAEETHALQRALMGDGPAPGCSPWPDCR